MREYLFVVCSFVLTYAAALPISYNCPSGWLENGDSCYKFVVGNDKDAEDAGLWCNAFIPGAHLVSINNQQEFQFLTANIKTATEEAGHFLNSRELWWTSGAKDEYGSWYWKNNNGKEPFEVWELWYPGEPNNSDGNEDTINILLLNGKWGLNDINHSSKLRFICELDNEDEGSGEDLECKVTALGREYRGTLSETISGRSCQRWDNQWPHMQSGGDLFVEEAYVHKNYCRNPDNEPGGPWCYTNDPDKRWEHCDVPFCDGEFQCPSDWKDNDESCYKFVIGNDKGPEAAAEYCRSENPDSHLVSIDNRSEFDYLTGAIQQAVEDDGRTLNYRELWWTSAVKDENGKWYWHNHKAMNPNLCKKTDIGIEYRGTVATTLTNRKCQRWDSQYPHEQTRGALFADGPSVHKNYCRNPDHDEIGGPWCYTTDPNSRWEYCDIPICPTDAPLGWALWYPGEPNNDGGNEDYINLLLLYGDWGLNDIDGTNRLRFICELDKE